MGLVGYTKFNVYLWHMKIHAKAALTFRQRQEIKTLYETGNFSYQSLAIRFATTSKTVQKWAKRKTPQDVSSAPKQPCKRITEAYESAVLSYRQQEPTHGKVRIAHELKKHFAEGSASSVHLILKKAGLINPKASAPVESKAINVGRHRTQMDIQHLPCIAGSQGFEYKISIIHLSTRIKYSEIHDNYESKTVAGVFERSLDVLPPFS